MDELTCRGTLALDCRVTFALFLGSGKSATNPFKLAHSRPQAHQLESETMRMLKLNFVLGENFDMVL